MKYLSASLAAIALAAAFGCAETQTKESTGQYLDDSAITTKVKTAIFNAPELKSSEITVETYKGRVQLSGSVSSQANIDQAASIARNVGGVASVKNDLLLK